MHEAASLDASDVSHRADRPVVLTAITASWSSVLLSGQLSAIRRGGFEPILLSGPGPEVEALCQRERIRLVVVPMEREVRLLEDIVSLCRIVMVLKRERPRIVNAGTPKAGLLVLLAACWVRVPVRIYTQRGFKFESFTGVKRRILMVTEAIACRLAHRVICTSLSIRQVGLASGIMTPDRAIVIGRGSSNGIDLKRFSPTAARRATAKELRQKIGIQADAFVIGLVARLTPSKGVAELLEAWQIIRARHSDVHLVLVGGDEEEQPLPQRTLNLIASDERVHRTGFVTNVEDYFALLDLFVLPTHREGFSNVLIQAAAMEIPIVATRVTGAQDAVCDGFNGILVESKNVAELTGAILRYIEDDTLRREHGSKGPIWAKNFAQDHIWTQLVDLYRSLLAGIKN